jgi:two-component system sensor histidine kinase/response regulator
VVVNSLLRRDGHEVTLTSNGAEALAMLRAHPYDLVLMDMQMPVMDGIEATHAIRSDPALRTLPIIALTANALPREVERCRLAGMNDHLAKPVHSAHLRTIIATWASNASTTEPRPTVATSAPSAIGLSVISEIIAGERLAFAEFLTMASDLIDADLRRLERCLATHDTTVAADASHRLAGTCGSIHSAQLRALSAAIDGAARDEAWDDVAPMLAEFRAVAAMIRSYAASPPD